MQFLQSLEGHGVRSLMLVFTNVIVVAQSMCLVKNSAECQKPRLDAQLNTLSRNGNSAQCHALGLMPSACGACCASSHHSAKKPQPFESDAVVCALVSLFAALSLRPLTTYIALIFCLGGYIWATSCHSCGKSG